MSNCCGSGALSNLAIGLSSNTPTRMDFTHVYGITVVKTLSDGSSQTIRGRLNRTEQNVGEGVLIVRFRVVMWLTNPKFNILLPCMGFTNVSTLWTLVDALPEVKVIVGPAGAPEVTYDGCVVTDWNVIGRKGGDPIAIDIGFIGKTRTPHTAGTFFTSTTSPTLVEGWIYEFPDGSFNRTQFSLGGATRLFPIFKLGLNYHVIDEYLNSVTATNLCPTDHDLTFGTNSLYTVCDSTDDLLSEPMSGDTTGDPLVIDLQRTVDATTYITTFNVANLKLIARDPDITKTRFNMLPIQGRGYELAAGGPLLTITNSPA